jgi:hypothetical protein
LVLVGERRGEILGEVSNSAVVIVQRDAGIRVEGRAGCERGHWSTVPKQAATHAQLRTGAIHSTTPNIGLPSRENKNGYTERQVYGTG